jgi:hypothetical protein
MLQIFREEQYRLQMGNTSDDDLPSVSSLDEHANLQ